MSTYVCVLYMKICIYAEYTLSCEVRSSEFAWQGQASAEEQFMPHLGGSAKQVKNLAWRVAVKAP